MCLEFWRFFFFKQAGIYWDNSHYIVKFKDMGARCIVLALDPVDCFQTYTRGENERC